jgi:hypothetical protein
MLRLTHSAMVDVPTARSSSAHSSLRDTGAGPRGGDSDSVQVVLGLVEALGGGVDAMEVPIPWTHRGMAVLTRKSLK